MAQSQHLIELNGKIYDAASGTALDSKKKLVMDGVIAPKNIKVVSHSTSINTKKTEHSKAPKAPIAHIQKSKTLMRASVKKPAHHSSATPLANHRNQSIQKPAHESIARLSRAEKIAKSRLVSRFGSIKSDFVNTQVMPLTVEKLPENVEHTSSFVKMMPVPELLKKEKSIDFENAVNLSKSHQQTIAPKPKLRHKIIKKSHLTSKIAKFSAISASIVLLGGFFFWQNLPNLSTRLAASKAGVAAKVPGYNPAGFSLSSTVYYKPGQISLNYKSNSDERSFVLTQTSNSPSDSTKIEELLANKDQNYQTIEENGKTIYLYGNSSAIWSNENTVFEVEGDSSLTSEQLIKFATSI